MIRIVGNGEEKCRVSLDSQNNTFDRNNSYLLKKELSSILKPGADILIDIEGIRIAKPGAISMLSELVNIALTKKCNLQFTGVDAAIGILRSSPLSFSTHYLLKINEIVNTGFNR